jgi:hypothetical protein
VQKQISVAPRPQHAHNLIAFSINSSLQHTQPVDGDFAKLGGLFDREQYRKAFCSARYSNGLFTTLASTEPSISAAKRTSGLLAIDSKVTSLLSSTPLRLSSLIDREIRRAAEGVDRQPFPFEVLDAGDVGTRDDRVAARFRMVICSGEEERTNVTIDKAD